MVAFLMITSEKSPSHQQRLIRLWQSSLPWLDHALLVQRSDSIVENRSQQ